MPGADGGLFHTPKSDTYKCSWTYRRGGILINPLEVELTLTQTTYWTPQLSLAQTCSQHWPNHQNCKLLSNKAWEGCHLLSSVLMAKGGVAFNRVVLTLRNGRIATDTDHFCTSTMSYTIGGALLSQGPYTQNTQHMP